MPVDRIDVSSGTGEGGMKAVWLGRDWLPEFQRPIRCGVEVGRGAWVHCTQCPAGGHPRVGRCKNAWDIGAYCRGSRGAGRAPSQRPVVRGEGSWENIFVADGQWKHSPGLALPNQTWVCPPTCSKANLLTRGCGEGKCSIYGRHQARSPGSWCSESLNPPMGVSKAFLKAK